MKLLEIRYIQINVPLYGRDMENKQVNNENNLSTPLIAKYCL